MDTTHDLYDPTAEPPTVGDHDGFDIYPMPVWLSLESPNPSATVEFLTTGLGFSTVFTGPEIGGLPMLTHLRLGRYQDILVSPARGAVNAGTGLVPTLMHADVDGLAEQLELAGAADAIVDGPVDRPWGARDLVVTTPDGHRLGFSQPPAAPPTGTVDEAMSRIADEFEVGG
ncbi:MAG: hypothetical protein ABGZ36_10820 [Actinomycetota bacterium]